MQQIHLFFRVLLDPCRRTTFCIEPWSFWEMGSGHCEFWKGMSHYLLLKSWISKTRGPEFAIFEPPPNISQFDLVSTCSISSKSAILQACLNNIAKERGPQAPVINVVLPNNFGMYHKYSGIVHPHNAPMAIAGPNGIVNPPVLPAAQPVTLVTHETTSLIPASFIAGEKLDIETFSTIFELPPSIVQCLTEHRITGSHAFTHMTLKDLDNMNFKLGEKIDLKEAIKAWARLSDNNSLSYLFS